MKILSLNPNATRIAFALFRGFEEPALRHGEVEAYRGASCRGAVAEILRRCDPHLSAHGSSAAWAVRIPFGGDLFNRSVLLSREVLLALQTLIPQRPLHLPAIIELLLILQQEYPSLPVVLAFESAFFTTLPTREACYALNAQAADELRRFGQQGLFHGAACAQARLVGRHVTAESVPKIISCCLEPNPELAAVIGERPVMVTSGLTPLEGLPGRTTCGELDPGIIITLNAKKRWGPERIGQVLAEESGLLGLTGQRIDIQQLMTEPQYAASLARALLSYRLLLACGAGIAALGGIDALVFSGRYAALGRQLGPQLLSSIFEANPSQAKAVDVLCYTSSVERVVADEAAMLLMGSGPGRPAASRPTQAAQPAHVEAQSMEAR